MIEHSYLKALAIIAQRTHFGRIGFPSARRPRSALDQLIQHGAGGHGLLCPEVPGGRLLVAGLCCASTGWSPF